MVNLKRTSNHISKTGDGNYFQVRVIIARDVAILYTEDVILIEFL